jgi:hypothetical protein
MMCVCVTVVTDSQDVETSAEEPETATEQRPETNTTTHDVPENHDISTGGYHKQLSGVWSEMWLTFSQWVTLARTIKNLGIKQLLINLKLNL